MYTYIVTYARVVTENNNLLYVAYRNSRSAGFSILLMRPAFIVIEWIILLLLNKYNHGALRVFARGSKRVHAWAGVRKYSLFTVFLLIVIHT